MNGFGLQARAYKDEPTAGLTKVSPRLWCGILLLLVILLPGCGGPESGGLSKASDTPSTTPTLPGVSGNFKQAAVVSFLAPSDGPEGFVDISPGAVSNAQRNAILSRSASPAVQRSMQRVLGRHIEDDTHSHLYQFTIRSVPDGAFVRSVYGLDRLLGEAEPYIAYTPEVLFARSPHNGITPRISLAEGPNNITITWTIPTDGTPTLVTVQPINLLEGDIGKTVPAGSNQIVQQINVTVQDGIATGTVSVNGEVVMDLSTSGTGINFFPMLEHPASGLFHCTMVRNGEVLVDESYLQRRLKWEPTWPIIERSTFEPITFNHRLVWDTGNPSVEANQPRWRATFPGASIPPAVNGDRPYQQGAQASFTYDPEHLAIMGLAVNEAVRLRLVPEGGKAADPEPLVQAREAKTNYTYRVEADAVSYPRSNGGFSVDQRYSTSAGGLVPAKIPQLFVDAAYSPNPTTHGQGSTLSADVVTFFYEDPLIRWSYQLDGPDPEDPENGITYQTEGTDGTWQDFDQDFLLQIPWNGKAPSGAFGPIGSYFGTLTVEVRERDGSSHSFAQEHLVLEVPPVFKIVSLAANPPRLSASEFGDVQISAEAELTGLQEPPGSINWLISVYDPQGQETYSDQANGQEPNFQTTWPARFDGGTESEDGALPDGVYQINAVAEIPERGLQAEKTIPFVIGDGHGLLIENLTVDPNPLNFEEQEEGMEGATVTADITPIELTESSSADWTLEIKPVDGAPVRILAGQVTLTFDSRGEEQQPTHFETFWDGRNEQGELVEEGEYLATLTVDPCRDGSQDCVASAEAPFTIAGEFAIEIRDEETNELLATSELESWQEPFPFIGPLAQAYPSELADATFLGPKNNQFLFVKAGQSRPLRVFIRTPRVAKPERLSIKASLSKSFPSGINVTLGRYATVDFGGSGYLNRLTLADMTSDNDDQLGIKRGLSQTFSAWDVNSNSEYRGRKEPDYPNWDDSEAFISILKSRGWQQYGKASWHDVNEIDMEDVDPDEHYVKTVAPTRDALRAAGYEDLVVKVFFDGQLKKKLWLRVKNEASCLYVSTHGSHDTGEIDGIGPWDLSGYWEQNLKLLIVAGCSVMDIGNLNDDTVKFSCNANFHTRGFGRQWKALLGPGSVCLGYTASAPLAVLTPGVPKMDDLIIRRFDAFGGFSSDPDTTALAWLKANMAEGGEILASQQTEQMTACAITDDNFYFIRHQYAQNANGEIDIGSRLKLRQVWRIHRSQWDLLNGHVSFNNLKSGRTRIATEYDI